jgi:D-alanyl-D-alanine carboxypeptidase
MPKLDATFSRKLGAVEVISLALAAVILTLSPAEARHWRNHHRHGFAHSRAGAWRSHYGSIRSDRTGLSHSEANIAAIVVDGNTGKTIFARNENDQRFPASITKVMTLYLLFEEIDEGRLRLDSNIGISAAAAAQKPTKLGLHPGETITVDDAIKAVVTRSANDIAVAIAEAIGGDESHFAALMTQKARELGMSRTHFANASGLPNAEQLTTAHDLAILGRTIQERFPRYYCYFATRVFYYRDAAIMNHNHLLDRVEGMDGIKTGYTNASGFNLLSSVKRDGHSIVAVVLGGASARERDRIMAGLIEDQIENSTIARAASLGTNTQAAAASQSRAGSPGPSESQLETALRPAFTPGAARPGMNFDQLPVASLNADAPPNRPRPAFVAGAPKPTASENLATEGEWGRSGGAGLSTATPAALHQGAGGGQLLAPKITARIADLPRITPLGIADPPRITAADLSRITPLGTADPPPITAADLPRPAERRDGWMIQIGATPDIDKATELLARAKSEDPKTLARAHAFTEKIQKGSETLYRARFAGLEADIAERVCKTLKRSGFSCFATRN